MPQTVAEGWSRLVGGQPIERPAEPPRYALQNTRPVPKRELIIGQVGYRPCPEGKQHNKGREPINELSSLLVSFPKQQAFFGPSNYFRFQTLVGQFDKFNNPILTGLYPFSEDQPLENGSFIRPA